MEKIAVRQRGIKQHKGASFTTATPLSVFKKNALYTTGMKYPAFNKELNKRTTRTRGL